MESCLFASVAKIPADTQVILASASPRRKELLTDMGIEFTVLAADCDENIPEGTAPVEAVKLLSERKAEAVRQHVGDDCIIIAADTLVELFGKPLGKPESEEDAFRMLCEMSGKKHFVHTGVTILYKGRRVTDADTAGVQFLPYTPTEAWTYVKTGEPMDKAGAYGIQGLGGGLVDSLSGKMDTVIGFPTETCDRMLSLLLSEAKE